MNTIREINRINERELQLGVKGSWHDEYKDSAYVFVGGLSHDLTEGDILTIFSQWGEIIDINLPRDKETGKAKGFCFLMYEDQRSTVLAVDNMNGAQVLSRIIRVDHTRNYKQPGKRNDEGEYEEPEEPTYNAMPPILSESESDDSSEDEKDNLDEEDPMAAFIRAEKKKDKSKSKGKAKELTQGEKGKKRKHDGESKEDRKKRKEEKRAKKEDKSKKRIKVKEEEKEGTPLWRKESRDTDGSSRKDRDAVDRKEEDRKGRANRDNWRDGKFELEREERERSRERDTEWERERLASDRTKDQREKDQGISRNRAVRGTDERRYDSRERSYEKDRVDRRDRYRDDDRDRRRDDRDRDDRPRDDYSRDRRGDDRDRRRDDRDYRR
ncbi:uncharacterized protein IL334_007329 [Kwoniella shivajii]|uniref:RRM domain-containing protein n=1 Tax=Kwoniella shivajii TaxID=564305 RepID=A0ABZ1D8D7_9TREE|nr:hypothetical protein IL334_007329 [Kwoniella shivajii]